MTNKFMNNAVHELTQFACTNSFTKLILTKVEPMSLTPTLFLERICWLRFGSAQSGRLIFNETRPHAKPEAPICNQIQHIANSL